MTKQTNLKPLMRGCLKELHLPTVLGSYEDLALMAVQETLSYERYLYELMEKEREVRRNNRTERLLKASWLPLEKKITNFDLKRLPRKVSQMVATLRDGSFINRRENILAFGNPGSGKTHLLCGLAQELIRTHGIKAYYRPCSLLVQELLIAKKELKLAQILKKLARNDLLIIDDIGYVQQSREEMEVLFTLFADRYEKGSIMLTSNLAFSKWEKIFKDPMVTAAAIDRLVHHSVILELNVRSYRIENAEKNKT